MVEGCICVDKWNTHVASQVLAKELPAAKGGGSQRPSSIVKAVTSKDPSPAVVGAAAASFTP